MYISANQIQIAVRLTVLWRLYTTKMLTKVQIQETFHENATIEFKSAPRMALEVANQ